MSRSRDIAAFLGKTEITNTENNALLNTASPTGLDSAQVSSIAASSGLTVYSTLNDLPSSGLTSGDQAFVSSTSRFYISNGSGWYNVALINATPSLTIDPTGTITLATDGVTPTVITLTATDSDNPIAALTYSVESDGNFGGLATISQDSSVFTITPLSEDSATTVSASLTFKSSDGISFGSGTRTITLAFKAQYSNYTTLLVKADTAGTDDQVDASSNSNTITEVGTVTSTALSPYHPGGYSIFLDGTGDYIQAAYSSGFDLDADFTIEAWIYPLTLSGNHLIIDTYQSGVNGSFQLYYRGTSGNSLAFYTTGDSVILQDPSSSTIAVNNWYHVAVTRSGTTCKMFINGTEVDSVTNSRDLTHSNDIGIGAQYTSGTNYWNGYIRDVRVVKGTAVYTSAFTSPTAPLTAIANTSLLTCHLPYIADGSSNNNTITVNGNTLTKRFAPYDYEPYTKADYGGSVYVGGATSYVSTNLPAMNGDWTIEGWFQHTANSGTSSQNRLFGGATNDPMILNTGLTSLNVYIDNNLKIAANAAANADAVLDQWYHMALVRETTGNILKLYINGKLAGSQSGGTYNIDAKDPFGIGSDANSSSYGMTGYVADFRVVNGTAVYTAEFTPPTEPLTEIANTDLLTCTNKNDIWDTGSGNLLTKAGDVTASNTQRKFATSSAIYFDGTGDYMVVASDDGFDHPGDFTWELWVYITAHAGGATDVIMSTYQDSTNGITFGIFSSTGKLYFAVGGDANQIDDSGALPLNTWTHLAGVRSDSTVTFYVNGTSVGTTTKSGTLTSTSDLTFGTNVGGGSLNFTGYIQDVRITNGLARYTSAFTPPTAEFTG